MTIRLGKGFTNVAVSETTINVGAGMLDRLVSMVACEEALKGLEHLCGIPGTIGGALRMNAGCYGSEMKDILEVAFAVDGRGKFHTLTNGEMGFKYRWFGKNTNGRSRSQIINLNNRIECLKC